MRHEWPKCEAWRREEPKIEVRRVWFLGEGSDPPARSCGGELLALPAWSGAEPRPSNSFCYILSAQDGFSCYILGTEIQSSRTHRTGSVSAVTSLEGTCSWTSSQPPCPTLKSVLHKQQYACVLSIDNLRTSEYCMPYSGQYLCNNFRHSAGGNACKLLISPSEHLFSPSITSFAINTREWNQSKTIKTKLHRRKSKQNLHS